LPPHPILIKKISGLLFRGREVVDGCRFMVQLENH
jgi:hypothetical protein